MPCRRDGSCAAPPVTPASPIRRARVSLDLDAVGNRTCVDHANAPPSTVRGRRTPRCCRRPRTSWRSEVVPCPRTRAWSPVRNRRKLGRCRRSSRCGGNRRGRPDHRGGRQRRVGAGSRTDRRTVHACREPRLRENAKRGHPKAAPQRVHIARSGGTGPVRSALIDQIWAKRNSVGTPASTLFSAS